ncbi:MAG: nitrogen regulation protein NR(I) [Polyangiales bacterium]
MLVPSSNATSSGEGKPTTLSRVVLCVDDDADYLDLVRRMVTSPGVEAIGASSAEDALELIEKQRVDAIVTDLNLPERTGIELIATLRGAGNAVPILVLTGEGSVTAAVEALKQGAADFLQKPVDAQRLKGLVTELLRNGPSLSGGVEAPGQPSPTGGAPLDSDLRPVSADGWFEGMLGRSPSMRQVFDSIERVARTVAPVLIVGESGSGKLLVARAIHARSGRRHGAFVPVHTGAIPKELVASELFGHERGAFTGALTAADGKFEAASRGSIFLDEVGTMVHDVQIALLRVLETMRFTRVGGRKEHVAEVRVIAATNRDLLTAVQENKFREDLYFRLNVFSIVLPPLRERREDIGPLAEHYLHRFAQRYSTPVRRIHPQALERLVNYPWPGNVRELRNVMERAAVFATTPDLLANDLQLVAERLPEPGQVVRETTARSGYGAATRAYDGAVGGDYASGAGQPMQVAPNAAPAPAVAAYGVAADHGPAVAAVIPPSYRPIPTPMGMPALQQHEPTNPNAIVITLGTTIQEAEKSLILRTLDYVGGNKQKAARVLGISRRCLYNRLEEYGVMKATSEAAHEGEEEPATPDVEAV